jgi:putative ATPase
MPLAARMRPRTLDEFMGQEHLVGPDRVLRRSIEADQLPSIIFWGPPGSGKTTLAEIIARTTRSRFAAVSAVSAGVADLRRIAEEAEQLRRALKQRTILFIDELHRFNKGQQDAVLPHVERGLLTLIGATTENPGFSVNSALLSRARVFTLHKLEPEHIERIVDRALTDERGLAGQDVQLAADARRPLVAMADGAARGALHALELAAAAAPQHAGRRKVTLKAIEEALQHPVLLYDRAGEQHYDLISAFIKSVRGSDADAAVYWLARMLESGEDLMFVARRIVILAAEDIGLADPQALSVAVAAQQAAHFVGLPEAVLPLAEATLYLATAPKSNSALTAYGAAREDVAATLSQPVPLHLRNAGTWLDRAAGHGKGYQYAHEHEGGVAAQEHLPEALRGRRYYQPGSRGYEGAIAQRLQGIRRRLSGAGEPPPPGSARGSSG